jgi:hypothetical protein
MVMVADAPWIGHCGDEYYETEREVFGHCYVCGEEIYYGDEYYEVGKEKVCHECMASAKTIAR